jgi:hypothetical protein
MNKQHYVPDMMGCSDGGCIFHYKAPGTMVTNGGCQCAKELMRSEAGQMAYRTINWLRRNWPVVEQGYCRMGDNCLCGGDVPEGCVPAVREGCFEWKQL